MCLLIQALEFERLGPERPPFSDAARRRIAAMEAATALTCTLLPAIEPVALVGGCYSMLARPSPLPPAWPAAAESMSEGCVCCLATLLDKRRCPLHQMTIAAHALH